MFIRTVIKPNGKQYHYVLKSVHDRKRGHSIHQRIADLTYLPLQVVEIVKAMLQGARVEITEKAASFVRVRCTRYFAPLWIALHFWADLKVRNFPGFSAKEYQRLSALVLARTVEPLQCRSESRTAKWLCKSALHLILGGSSGQWDRDQFYPLLSKLSQHWPELEDYLWKQRRNVPRLYLYDITSTYFEGKGGSLGALGHSRDEKRSNPQVVIALAADEQGLPIALRILPGNTKDETTVKKAVAELKQRFEAEKAVLIMDRGMRSEGNLEFLTASGLDYIMALPHKSAREFLLKHNTHLEWELFDQRHLAEWWEDGRRYILCRNPQTAQRDRNTRNRILARAEKRLLGLVNMAEKGRIKNRDKIMVRAVKIFTQTKTEKYFHYEVEEGRFRYWRSELVDLLETYEGCYVLSTSLPAAEATKKEVDQTYRNQREIEEVFKSCKDELYLRPNFHREDKNILGHIYLTFLAHLVKKRLELTLREHHCTERGSTFLSHFSDIVVNLVEINGESQNVITDLNEDQRRLAACAGVRIPSGPVHGSLRSLLPKNIQHL